MEKLQKVASAFQKRGMVGKIYDDEESALEDLIHSIPIDAVVAFGGSVTLKQMGIYEKLLERGNPVIWHWKVPSDMVAETCRQALQADVYLTSCNAVIEDGRLLNIDGTGNRMAAMVFGPKRVIVVAGKNKISHDYDSALARIKEIACPQNAERLNRDIPCRTSRKCQDCRSPLRMCKCTYLIESPTDEQQLEVWLINQVLGY